ncbi:MAG: hypothetical protein ACXVXQ_06535 [Mycobacteriaceae bacterium]
MLAMSLVEVLSPGAEVGLFGRVGGQVDGSGVGLDRFRGSLLSPEQIASAARKGR